MFVVLLVKIFKMKVCWGGRYAEGVGAGAGEDMEQAFSHLSRTGSTTKHMSAAGKIII